MIRTEIHPGVCGFKAAVEAEVRDYQFVTLKVQSECDTIKKGAAADALCPPDCLNRCRWPRGSPCRGTVRLLLRRDGR